MNFWGTKNVLSGIRQAIRDIKPDIVLLQEVIGDSQLPEHKMNDWPNTAQFEYLADQMWPHHAYGQNAVLDNRHYGNVILSRFPIISSEQINISTNPFEKRGMLHATVRIPDHDNRSLDLICLHHDLTGFGRQRQIRRLADRIREQIAPRQPLIVAGDFNDWRRESSRQLRTLIPLEEAHHHLHGSYAKTFPVFMPLLPLDRIYYSHLQPTAALVHRGHRWNQLSDHSALQADFKWLE